MSSDSAGLQQVSSVCSAGDVAASAAPPLACLRVVTAAREHLSHINVSFFPPEMQVEVGLGKPVGSGSEVDPTRESFSRTP